MAKPSTNKLSDKDVRMLKPRQKDYLKVVGEPKELYLIVRPSGLKTFCLIYFRNHKKVKKKIGEFQKGIFSVAEARAKAIKLLKEKENLTELTINELTKIYLKKKLKDTTAKEAKREVKRHESRLNRFVLPKYGDKRISQIDLIELRKYFISLSPRVSTGVLIRTVGELKMIGELAFHMGVAKENIFKNINLSLVLPKPQKSNYPAIKDLNEFKKLIQDIKYSPIKTIIKVALFTAMLTAQRSGSIVSAKWSDMDLKKKIWKIPSSNMKVKENLIDGYHLVVLSPSLIKMLSELTKTNEYVFSWEDGHIDAITLSRALRSIGYLGRHNPHSFRISFSTFCYDNRDELIALGIDLAMIELVQAHTTPQNSGVAMIYNRSHNQSQKEKLMIWYDEFLNKLEPLVLEF